MQTVLGLVIHRFDIHIKRETGCFDVRGEQVPGDCWSSTLFFTDTAQHSLGGWGGVGVGGGWGGVVGADCWGRGVQKNSKWGAVIPLCWLDVTPTPPPFFTHQPPTYARPLRINHKITPILIPLHPHQWSIHTLPYRVSPPTFSSAAFNTLSIVLIKQKSTSHNFLSPKTPEGWVTERRQWANTGVGNEAVSKIASSQVEKGEFFDSSLMCMSCLG